MVLRSFGTPKLHATPARREGRPERGNVARAEAIPAEVEHGQRAHGYAEHHVEDVRCA